MSAVHRRGKGGFRVQAEQTETAICRCEREVRARRRHGVEAIGLDIIEMIIAARVSDCAS